MTSKSQPQTINCQVSPQEFILPRPYAVSFSAFAAMTTASYFRPAYTRSVVTTALPAASACISFLTVLPLNLYVNLSLGSIHSLFSTSDPELGE